MVFKDVLILHGFGPDVGEEFLVLFELVQCARVGPEEFSP